MLRLRQDPDLDSVWRWFEFQNDLINERLTLVVRSFSASPVTVADPNNQSARFVGLTRAEVTEFFEMQKDHLNSAVMFELLATTEAILRIDFGSRVARRRRDSLSRRYRKIKQDREKIRLDEDILEAMKEEGVRVGDFRGTLNLRHWLAHGRHWVPKLGQSYTPQVVFDISKVLIDSIPLLQ